MTTLTETVQTMPISNGFLPNETTRPTFPWRPRRGLVSYGVPFPQLTAAHIDRLKKQRVFAVVSGSLAKNTNFFEALKDELGDRLVGSHVGFRPHVPWNDVLALAKEVDACGADVIVTLGGGSITDAVKIVSLCLGNGITELEPMSILSKRLVFSMRKDVDFAFSSDPPDIQPARIAMINIPTTLSAGEYSPYAGGIDPRDGVKKMFVHQSLYADVVILDPVLGATVPEWVWISSGVRSIDHCVETLGSLVVNEEQTKEASVEGLVLLARGLLKLRKDPNDLQSRLETQLGSNYAMDGLSRGIHLGASHAIGHELGAMGVTHGHTSCILSPTVMKYNASVNADRQKRAVDALWADQYIAQVLGQRGLRAATSDLGDVLDGLFRAFGMPRTLKEVGIEGEEKLHKLAKWSLEDPWTRTNPIPITTEAQVLEILHQVTG